MSFSGIRRTTKHYVVAAIVSRRRGWMEVLAMDNWLWFPIYLLMAVVGFLAGIIHEAVSDRRKKR